eukprot:2393298-Prymnesium_polylepis.1
MLGPVARAVGREGAHDGRRARALEVAHHALLVGQVVRGHEGVGAHARVGLAALESAQQKLGDASRLGEEARGERRE